MTSVRFIRINEMTTIDKILIALDRSSDDMSVFDSAVSLAQTTGASLMLLHIISEEDPDYPLLPTYVYYSALNDSDGGILQQTFAEYEQSGIDFLRNLTKKAIAAGINTEYVQLNGIPGWEICQLASTWSADLIVVGSRGLKGLKEMFLGSVSNYVSHHAPCSVLIVRTPTESVSDREQEADTKREIATD